MTLQTLEKPANETLMFTELVADLRKERPWDADIAAAVAKMGPGPAPAPTSPEPKPGLVKASAPGIGGLIETFDSFNIPVLNVALPIGSALVGIGLGTVAGGVIDRALPPKNAPDAKNPDGSTNWINPIVHVGVGAAGLAFGSRFAGRPAALFFAGTIGFKLAVRYTPVGEWLASLEDALSKPFEEKPAAASYRNTRVQNEADRIVHDAGPYEGTGL